MGLQQLLEVVRTKGRRAFAIRRRVSEVRDELDVEEVQRTIFIIFDILLTISLGS